jgi:hypothetical protein
VTQAEFFRWWIVDERTRKRRLTTYKLTRAEAAERFPGAEPDMQSLEVRQLAGTRRDSRQQAPAPSAKA